MFKIIAGSLAKKLFCLIGWHSFINGFRRITTFTIGGHPECLWIYECTWCGKRGMVTADKENFIRKWWWT